MYVDNNKKIKIFIITFRFSMQGSQPPTIFEKPIELLENLSVVEERREHVLELFGHLGVERHGDRLVRVGSRQHEVFGHVDVLVEGELVENVDLSMREARLDALLEQVEHVDATRDADQTHRARARLNGVEQGVEQQLGLVLGEQVELVEYEDERLGLLVAGAERLEQELEVVGERADHLVVDHVVELQLAADLQQRRLVVIL